MPTFTIPQTKSKDHGLPNNPIKPLAKLTPEQGYNMG
jgi:hypothetical protein